MTLRKSCQHDLYEAHIVQPHRPGSGFECPGGEFATLDDLIAAINGLGVDGVVRVSYIEPDEALVPGIDFRVDD